MSNVAGRAYARVYRVSGRSDLHAFLTEAVEASGGRVLYASNSNRAPIFLGVQLATNERLGLLCYPFRCNPPPIKGRQADEHRLQVRYGGEATWEEDHPLGFDVAGVDVTLVLGVHVDRGILVGLDPLLYDPLPMGISVEFKDHHVEQTLSDGWTVWERVTRPGPRRGRARSLLGIETLIGFRPERLIDYARFERHATSLGLDPPLRYRAAQAAPAGQPGDEFHRLEREFELSSREVLGIIEDRMRLKVAVRGGVAEHHLRRSLEEDTSVVTVVPIDEDGRPDFEVTLESGQVITVECKNVSPERRGDGGIKVEVQKTRASKGDPASRFYRPDQFDLVAASLWPATDRWEFRFKRSEALQPHSKLPDRIAPIQTVDETWSQTIAEALSQPAS